LATQDRFWHSEQATAGWYRFRLGSFELTTISDGPLPIYPASRGFIEPAEDEIQRILHDNFLPADHLALDQNALVINTGKHNILIDTGVGTSSELQSRKYGPSAGQLLVNMRAAGIDPHSIDIVALTHPHHDHCWGLVDDKGALNFPNAQLAMSEMDFHYWTDEAKMSGTSPNPAWVRGARRNLLPYQDRLIFVSDGMEVALGITAIKCPGHTLGHLNYLISSGAHSLLHMGDAIHHELLLLKHPEWRVVWDTDPDIGVRSRVRMLDMLAADRCIAFGYHCAWPGLGHVVKYANEYTWIGTPMRTILDKREA
jgi:glyoxylase-like metal-dependent hydrolase (beta-lactamase superfamily II)